MTYYISLYVGAKRLVFHLSPRDGHVIIVSGCLILTAVNLIVLIRMAYITERLIKLCKIYCDIWHRLTWSVYTGGRVVLRYVITKFSRMDILPNFVTHSAPLSRARELRCYAIEVRTCAYEGKYLPKIDKLCRPLYASEHANMVIPTSHWTGAYPSVMWFRIGINNYREKWRILSVWKISYFSNNEWVSVNVQIDH